MKDSAAFDAMVLEKIPPEFQTRVGVLLSEYGDRLRYAVANAALHARDAGKLEAVVSMMDEHLTQDLQFQHPEIRGRVTSLVSGNKTDLLFKRIFEDVLGLKPTDKSHLS